MNKISDYIINEINENKYTVVQMADKYQVPHSYISALKNGKYDDPTVLEATNFCRSFGWDVDTLKKYVNKKDKYYYSKVESKLSSTSFNIDDIKNAINCFFDSNLFEIEKLTVLKNICQKCEVKIDSVKYTFYFLKTKRLSKFIKFVDDNIRDFTSIYFKILKENTGNHVVVTSSLNLFDEIKSLFSKSLISRNYTLTLFYCCKNRKEKLIHHIVSIN